MSVADEHFVLKSFFPVGVINKNGDVITFDNYNDFPIESGTIIFSHVVPKHVYDKFMENSEDKLYVSMECKYEPKICGG